MSQILHAVSTLLSDPHTHILADDPPATSVPNPIPSYKPQLPSNVSGPTGTILGWVAGGGLALAVLGGLLGWAAVAVGENSERGGMAARGKKAIIMSLIAGIGIACTSGLVFAAYSMAA
ncbi:hypothetical protein GCM10018790_77870 [Kitasatospora xanthocidica]|uniref:hypothetical protein n=1 Tax=Kitasatospora xanthocidica TaxID=83382 RepID=UPI001672513F|nr:hypothetical protein [Kitasatospora xanthocidica]GHF88934.1 hypothetical protein GCM10018790_77870 [Kitasatospora xanthocidica]